MINKKVSVLIASYNNDRYISECIQSIINQTHKNVEIIIFDDLSNDNSTDIIKRFKNVKLITNDRRGSFGSYNQMNAYKEAFRQSSGEIIFFLDSDDYFDKEKINKILNKFESKKDIEIIYDLIFYQKIGSKNNLNFSYK